jgi:hypothetical protein
MTITISLGWWLAPALITALAVAWALAPRDAERPTGGMLGDFGQVLGLLIRVPTACAVALAAWLIWSLMR